MSDSPTSPLEQLQQLTELMQSAANLHDWPRVTALNERRNGILHRLTNIDPAHGEALTRLVEGHNALVEHVNRIRESLDRQRAYLGVSRHALGQYLAIERASRE